MIFMTGDFITSSSRRVEELGEVLGGLKSKFGAFACLGNHDIWNQPHRVRVALERHGIRVLTNEHSRVRCADGEIVVAGLDSVWGGYPNWAKARRGLKGDDRVLMLMHEPDYAEILTKDASIVLQCSGHTHGGQVRVPGWGALILPRYGKRYQAGLYRVGPMQLHVNRGIGTVDQHVRFWCPPEIACLEVTNIGRF